MRVSRSSRSLFAFALAALAAVSFLPAQASAEIGSQLLRFGKPGSGAGELRLNGEGAARGGGIVADPSSGHIFISENGNNRISEFTAWGEFVKAWGFGVADGSTAALQTCTATCFKGVKGTGAGQLYHPNGMAIGPSGNLYVFERENNRVQVFNQAGGFERMFGGGVNATAGTDLCTKADLSGGDVCGAGAFDVGPGEFSVETWPGTAGDYIDIGPDDLVYVGDENRIQKFDLDGAFIESFPAPEPGRPGALAVDPISGDVYFNFAPPALGSAQKGFRLSATGSPVGLLPTTFAVESVAVDAGGNVFASEDRTGPRDLLEIDPSGAIVGGCCALRTFDYYAGLATNTVTAAGETNLYMAFLGSVLASDDTYIEVRGPAPDKWPPPVVPPQVGSQYAKTVRSESTVLGAEIDPNFWADTEYRVEYGKADCAEGGCATTSTRQLNGGIVKRPIPTAGVALSGLEPNTTYHYRFVAESGGGGPVYGEDRTFTTYPASPPPAATDCPNQVFRSGSSAFLSDCRAFEMVSPVDKEGGDLVVQRNVTGDSAKLNQAALSGEKVTYSASRAFGDADSSPYTNQYMAARTVDGWANSSISPPRDFDSFKNSGVVLDSQYKGFLEDLSAGWLLHDVEPLLAPGAVPGFPNLYRRDLLSGGYETQTTEAPPKANVEKYTPTFQGSSADGTHTVFTAGDKLTPDASSTKDISQVYESYEGGLRLVSVLPNGKASGIDSTLGSGSPTSSREGSVKGAISADGSRIYWSEDFGARRLFVRLDGAATMQISTGTSTFWAARPDGLQALYTEGGALKLFDLDAEASTSLATGATGVMGASEDLSRVYFVSTDDLADGAEAGRQNVYLYQRGSSTRFVATLSGSDVMADVSNPIAIGRRLHVSRVTDDGGSVVFMSRAALTGADNIDIASGKADAQVYRYEAESGELDCVSCNPTGARPLGAEEIGRQSKGTGYHYSGRISGWEFQNHAPRNLSEDGERVFFDSPDRLVLADTNGVRDVYQWQEPGSGECTEAALTYNPRAGGCVTLVSDGQGATASEFVDASTDGKDVFFLTGQSLVSWDPGLIDLYDARTGGGFPAPPTPPAACEGEVCQDAVVPPPAPPFSSQTFKGPGNPAPAVEKKQKKKKRQKAKQRKRQKSKKQAQRKKQQRQRQRQRAQRAKGGKR